MRKLTAILQTVMSKPSLLHLNMILFQIDPQSKIHQNNQFIQI
jgi:hypothetical protein